MSDSQHAQNASATNTQAGGLQTQEQPPQDCMTCRVIGTAALGATGIYALNMSRARAPGSPLGKRIMAGVGVGFLFASAFRWAV